jgi:hypothetical protein
MKVELVRAELQRLLRQSPLGVTDRPRSRN